MPLSLKYKRPHCHNPEEHNEMTNRSKLMLEATNIQ